MCQGKEGTGPGLHLREGFWDTEPNLWAWPGEMASGKGSHRKEEVEGCPTEAWGWLPRGEAEGGGALGSAVSRADWGREVGDCLS